MRYGSHFLPPIFMWTFLLILLCMVSYRGEAAGIEQRTSVDFLFDGYVTDSSLSHGQGHLRSYYFKEWSQSRLGFDVSAGLLLKKSKGSYTAFDEVYYSWWRKGLLKFSFGRKSSLWSIGDEHWKTGLIQPLWDFDKAIPRSQGLTGIFLNFDISESWTIQFFGSPFFIPSQGPSFELEQGSFSSVNPWFNEPVQALSLSGGTFDLSYELETPSITEVVMQQSYGIQLARNLDKKGFKINLFYFDKPKNELITPFRGSLNFSTLGGDILILPKVARHRISGLETGWAGKKMSILTSWINESEIQFDQGINTYFPQIPHQNIYSLMVDYKTKDNTTYGISLLETVRQKTKFNGPLGNLQIDFFNQRNRFDRALRLFWSSPLLTKAFGQKLKTTIQWTHDPQFNESWLNWVLTGRVNKNLSLISRCDFFGSKTNSSGETNFLSLYQNNDRCLVGGRYVF